MRGRPKSAELGLVGHSFTPTEVSRKAGTSGVGPWRRCGHGRRISQYPKNVRGVVILADSKAAIAAVRKAGRTGKSRSRHLKKVVDEIAERVEGGGVVRVGWVKAHTGIPGNEAAEGVPLDEKHRVGV